jgi:hypothetical protein
MLAPERQPIARRSLLRDGDNVFNQLAVHCELDVLDGSDTAWLRPTLASFNSVDELSSDLT